MAADPTLAPAAVSERGIGLWHHMYGRVAAGVTVVDVARQANAVMAAVRGEFRVHSYSAMHSRISPPVWSVWTRK